MSEVKCAGEARNSEIIRELDDFLDKALRLEPGKEVSYSLPVGHAIRIIIRYQRPIAIYDYCSGYCSQRNVLWSPMKVRQFALKQMGFSYRRFRWPSMCMWRERRMAQWWATEWGGRNQW